MSFFTLICALAWLIAVFSDIVVKGNDSEQTRDERLVCFLPFLPYMVASDLHSSTLCLVHNVFLLNLNWIRTEVDSISRLTPNSHALSLIDRLSCVLIVKTFSTIVLV